MKWGKTRWKFRKLNYTLCSSTPALTSTALFSSTEGRKRRAVLNEEWSFCCSRFDLCWHQIFFFFFEKGSNENSNIISPSSDFWNFVSQCSSLLKERGWVQRYSRATTCKPLRTGHDACLLHLHPHIWHQVCEHLTVISWELRSHQVC